MESTTENVIVAELTETLAVLPGMLTVVAGVLTVVAAMLVLAFVAMGGRLWYLIELPEIFNADTSLKTCINCPKWPLNGTFHLKVTYVCTPGVSAKFFLSEHELSQPKIIV